MKTFFPEYVTPDTKVNFTVILNDISLKNPSNCTADVALVDLIDFNRPTLNYTVRDVVVNKTEQFTFYFEMNETTYDWKSKAKTYGPQSKLFLNDYCPMY